MFHLHKFDPDMWKQISSIPVARSVILRGVRTGEQLPMGNERVFSNTCLKCGDLVFRRVVEVEG